MSDDFVKPPSVVLRSAYLKYKKCRIKRHSFEFGSREWTRTTDPHHVKVVL